MYIFLYSHIEIYIYIYVYIYIVDLLHEGCNVHLRIVLLTALVGRLGLDFLLRHCRPHHEGRDPVDGNTLHVYIYTFIHHIIH